MRNLRGELLQLLRIIAPSGKEKPVANYLIGRLKADFADIRTDNFGNVLAERSFGTGAGPTILLSAHMDTVRVDPAREIYHDGDVWTSSSGPLGADDRAGIAIILDVVRRLPALSFSGKVKLAFTREEEIGCIGSQCIDEAWLASTDLAIVVDRRGNRDIVTHNRNVEFCSSEVSAFFEQIGGYCGMPNWKTVQGGVSDAVTYAMLDIPSVNVSAGYCNEHYEDEYVDVRCCEETVRFVTEAMLRYREMGSYNRRNGPAWRPSIHRGENRLMS